MEMDKFYYANVVEANGVKVAEKQGPVEYTRRHEVPINRDTLIWYSGLKEWTPAGNLSEFTDLFIEEPPELPSFEDTVLVKPAAKMPKQPVVTPNTHINDFKAKIANLKQRSKAYQEDGDTAQKAKSVTKEEMAMKRFKFAVVLLLLSAVLSLSTYFLVPFITSVKGGGTDTRSVGWVYGILIYFVIVAVGIKLNGLYNRGKQKLNKNITFIAIFLAACSLGSSMLITFEGIGIISYYHGYGYKEKNVYNKWGKCIIHGPSIGHLYRIVQVKDSDEFPDAAFISFNMERTEYGKVRLYIKVYDDEGNIIDRNSEEFRTDYDWSVFENMVSKCMDNFDGTIVECR